MTIHLPNDLESYVQSQVACGRFASPDEAIAEAVRRLRQAEQASSPPRPTTEAEFKRQLLAAGLMTSLPTAELTPEEIADQETQRRLLEAGIISEIKPPPRLLPARERFTPISITGEPMSETIIRERR